MSTMTTTSTTTRTTTDGLEAAQGWALLWMEAPLAGRQRAAPLTHDMLTFGTIWVVAGWTRDGPIRSQRRCCDGPAVVGPDPELVGSRRRRANLFASQAAPHHRKQPSSSFDDRPGPARRDRDRAWQACHHRLHRLAQAPGQSALPLAAPQPRRAIGVAGSSAQSGRVPGRL